MCVRTWASCNLPVFCHLSLIVSLQAAAALTAVTPFRVTPPAPHLSTREGTQSKQVNRPQLNLVVSNQPKPWTRPRPALPLTAALTALSYSLSETEFSADGDEAESGLEGPEIQQMVPALTFPTPGKVGSPLQRATSVQPGVRSRQTTHKHVMTCASMPCFPGVQCEPAVDGGFSCGRCPVGYIGDGRVCRGTMPKLHPIVSMQSVSAPISIWNIEIILKIFL